jgi:predicted SAM-dependent methyltransferase
MTTVVYLAEVFEHLRIDPIFRARELRRVLRPGGRLLLRTPNLQSLQEIYSFLVSGLACSCANAGWANSGTFVSTPTRS